MALLEKIKQARDKIADGYLYDSPLIRNASMIIDAYMYVGYGINEPIAKDIQFGLTSTAIMSKETDMQELIKHPLTKPFQKLATIANNLVGNKQFIRSLSNNLVGRSLIYGADRYPEVAETVLGLMGQSVEINHTNLNFQTLVTERKAFDLVEEYVEGKILEKSLAKEQQQENKLDQQPTGNQQLKNQQVHTNSHISSSLKETTVSNETQKVEHKEPGRFKPRTKEDRPHIDPSIGR